MIQRKRVEEWCKNEYKNAIEGQFLQVKRHVENNKQKFNKCSTEHIK